MTRDPTNQDHEPPGHRPADDGVTDATDELDELNKTAETADKPSVTQESKLLVDAMLGKLARYLRMCGYDTAYALDRGIEADDRLQELAREEQRLLITRNRGLSDRLEQSVLLESKEILEQLRELRESGFQIGLSETSAHCGSCNGSLERISDEFDRPEHAPAEGPVWQCVDCGQLFWKGSHWETVRERLSGI